MLNESGFTLIELLVVVAIVGIIATIAVPALLDAIDRSRQSVSMEHIASLARFVEIYIMDNKHVGCPKVGNDIEALRALLVAQGFKLTEQGIRDGWQRLLILETEAAMGGRAFTIMSYGSDGALGPATAEPGIVKHFEEDLIMTKGGFSQRPKGGQSAL